MFSWAHLGLVVLGGALGTAARAGLSVAFADTLGPLLVPLINLLGAFALGVVTGALARVGDSPRARRIRHFVGTGMLGGFTTYSALAVESAADTPSFLLGVASALAGTLAAWGGIALVRGRGRRA